MHDRLIILAGGASSRMKNSSVANLGDDLSAQANTRSKSLISIDSSGRPLMDYLLYNAKKAGYKTIYIVIGENELLIKEFYGTKIKGNQFHELIINYAIQYIPNFREKPFGTADALSQAINQYPELKRLTFTVCNSDNLYSVSVLNLLKCTRYSNALISYDRDALKFNLDRIARFALVLINKDGFLENIIEKPSEKETQLYKDEFGKLRVSMNIFKFDGTMISYYIDNCPVHPLRNEKELPTAILNMVKDYANSIYSIPVSEHVPDLTSKEDIASLKEYIEKHYSKMNWN